MSFRFGDPGGRMYQSTSFLTANWTSGFNVGNISIPSGQGRTTGSCLRLSPSFNGVNLAKTLDPQTTWGVAFGFRASLIGQGFAIIIFNDGGNTQIQLNFNADGTLGIARASTVLGNSSISLSENVWAHIELKITIGSAGSAELRINGATAISLSSVNTQATGNNTANTFYINAGNGGFYNQNFDFDDIILYDSQTTDAAGNPDIYDFIGDCGLAWVLPTGAGTYTEFTPSSGSNYSQVNNATPNPSDYVYSDTVSQEDSYTIASLPSGASSVKSIALCHYAEKDNIGGRQIGALLRTSSTDYIHPTGIDLGGSYLYSFRAWGSNPNTIASWTVSDVNGLEIGQVVNS